MTFFENVFNFFSVIKLINFYSIQSLCHCQQKFTFSYKNMVAKSMYLWFWVLLVSKYFRIANRSNSNSCVKFYSIYLDFELLVVY